MNITTPDTITDKKNNEIFEYLIDLLKEDKIDNKYLNKYLKKMFKKEENFQHYIKTQYPEKYQKIIDKISTILIYTEYNDDKIFQEKFGNIKTKTNELLILLNI